MIDRISKRVKKSLATIALHKFMLLKNKDEYAFFFVEGDDDCLFYSSKSRDRYTKKKILPLPCGGKEKVLDNYERTKECLDSKLVIGYFVDRDFDDNINNNIPSKVYVTPCYSVENLVFSKATFINILHEKFGLDISEEAYKKAENFYDKKSSEFYLALSLYNGWMYAQRSIPEDRKTGAFKFPKDIPKGFVSFSEEKITQSYSHNDIKNNHPNAPVISCLELTNSLAVINTDPPEQRYRGKLHWKLFEFILSYLIEDANNKEGSKILNNKVQFTFSKKDRRKFFNEIYHFASIPDCLNNYLNSMDT